MDLITSLTLVKRLSDFVEGGQLSAAMADAGIQAGVDALKTLPEVNDKRAQVWSAVNHLQYAEAALHAAITTNTGAKKLLRPLNLFALVDRREYLLCLLAACYRYLGEPILFEETLDQAESARAILNTSQAVMVPSAVFSMVNPATYVDIFRASPVRVRVDVFGDRIRELPGPDSSVELRGDPICVCGHRQTNHYPLAGHCCAIHRDDGLFEALQGGLAEIDFPYSLDEQDGTVFCECQRFTSRL